MGQIFEKKNRVGTRYFVDGKDEIVQKECRACKEVRSIVDFHRAKNGLGGRQADCKVCHLSYHIRDRENNLVKKRAWYQENREHVLAVNKNWQDENRERVTEYKRLWLCGNRATKALLPNNWSDEERITAEKFFSGCALSGDLAFEWDHVIPITSGFGGTTAANMIPLSKKLNASKGNRNIFEWFPGNKDRLGLSEACFSKTIAYLADLNGMTPDSYEEYVYSCFANKTKESII